MGAHSRYATSGLSTVARVCTRAPEHQGDAPATAVRLTAPVGITRAIREVTVFRLSALAMNPAGRGMELPTLGCRGAREHVPGLDEKGGKRMLESELTAAVA